MNYLSHLLIANTASFMGWLIMISLIIISILRIIIFKVMDQKGETIVHLENGKYNPSLKLAMDIARVFDVTVEELFTFTDQGK